MTNFAGCARNRSLIHPLENDFKLLKKNEGLIVPKDGAFMSDYFMCKVMAIDVQGVDCKEIQ